MGKVRTFFAIIFSIAAFSLISVNAQDYSYASKTSVKTIEQKVGKELRKLPRYSVFDHIDFNVNGSTVTLTGKTYSLGTKRDAVNFIKDVDGVTNVIDNIQELPPSPFDDRIRREAFRSFTSRGPAQYFSEINPDVRIIVENGRLTLEGYVTRESDSNLLNLLANGISGVFKVTNNLVVGKRQY